MPAFSENQGPLYRRLYQELRSQMEQHILREGDRLPSKRALAQQRAVSVNTVDAAYRQLEAEGFVAASPRRGFFVQPLALPVGLEPPPQAPEAEDSPKAPYLVDFSPFGIARERFPYNTWRRLMKSCFNEYDAGLLQRTPPQGDPGLRRAVSAYLYAARGVRCTPEQIVIGAGTDNLLFILAYLFQGTLAVEDPLYNHAPDLFRRLGHQVLSVPVTEEGFDQQALGELDHVLVYTTPSHQFPLGYAMPIGRRAELLSWCGRGRSRYVIEDDYDSEFRYDTQPIPSLQSIDRLGRVIYLGTFSRSVAPALRISYLVLPPALLRSYQRYCECFASTVSGFEQKVLRAFISQGYFETHVRRMRVYYREKRNLLLAALSPLQGTAELLGQPAGHHLTLRLHCGLSEEALVAAAADQGVRIYPVSPYFAKRPPRAYQSTVLLGFGGLDDEQIDRGAALLARAWLPRKEKTL